MPTAICAGGKWFARAAAFIGVLLVSATTASAQPEFRVRFDRSVRERPASGRLVVYLVKADSPADLAGSEPASGPFFESPQPMYGVDVRDLGAGSFTLVDDKATSFPVKLSELPAVRYKAQAVLDMHRLDSSWRREPGNLYSKVLIVDLKNSATNRFDIELTEVVPPPPEETTIRGVEYVEVPSAILTDYRGTPVTLKAGVVLPTGYESNPERRYAAVYEIPGFGGDHTSARMMGRFRRDPAIAELLRECVWITLNPEGPNGHHLFANSENNGPVGDALVKELIPALERRYRLVAEPSARLLRGHSSGGWSSIWLALKEPETFGAAWASSPDPVDFRHFQIPNIYADRSMYTRAATEPGHRAAEREIPSYRDTGDTRMTIRQENLMEEVLGPRNTSAQQWDSWLAVFGPRDHDGNPAALYDPRTGLLDPAVAEQFRRYDIADLLRSNPEKYAPILRQRVRLLCGSEDNYFLNEAVESLAAELEKVGKLRLPEGEHGYIKILPGRDHGTIMAAQEMRAIPGEMLAHLRRTGHIAR